MSCFEYDLSHKLYWVKFALGVGYIEYELSWVWVVLVSTCPNILQSCQYCALGIIVVCCHISILYEHLWLHTTMMIILKIMMAIMTILIVSPVIIIFMIMIVEVESAHAFNRQIYALWQKLPLCSQCHETTQNHANFQSREVWFVLGVIIEIYPQVIVAHSLMRKKVFI